MWGWMSYDPDTNLLFHGTANPAEGGNPATGKETIRRYGCQNCHSILGIRDANAVVGPPLDRFSQRIYLAGELPNTTENLMHWIQRPHEIHPHTAMPEMGVSDQDARDMAAYLLSNNCCALISPLLERLPPCRRTLSAFLT